MLDFFLSPRKWKLIFCEDFRMLWEQLTGVLPPCPWTMTAPRIAYLPRQTKTIASLGAVLMRLEGKTMLVCMNNLQFGKHPTKMHLSAMLNVIKGCWEMVEIIILSWMLDWTKTSHLVTQTYIGPLRDHCVDWYIKTYKFWACISTYQFYVWEKSWCYGFISHFWALNSFAKVDLWV